MMHRISRDEWGLQLAEVTASRGTCLRRQVGCILVDARGHVLATGYNGVAASLEHCNTPASKPWFQDPKSTYDHNMKLRYPHSCKGAFGKSGEGLEDCEAVHAEQNALIQCKDASAIHTCYVTVSCCVACTKMLMNTGCNRVVFREPYKHDEKARTLWEKLSREWLRVEKI